MQVGQKCRKRGGVWLENGAGVMEKKETRRQDRSVESVRECDGRVGQGVVGEGSMQFTTEVLEAQGNGRAEVKAGAKRS